MTKLKKRRGIFVRFRNYFIAGVVVLIPIGITVYLTFFIIRISSKILPEGSLQLICGSARGILDSVTSEDVVTFTGSADTGIQLKSHSKIYACEIKELTFGPISDSFWVVFRMFSLGFGRILDRF